MEVILDSIRGLGGTVLKTNVDTERAKLIQSTLALRPAESKFKATLRVNFTSDVTISGRGAVMLAPGGALCTRGDHQALAPRTFPVGDALFLRTWNRVRGFFDANSDLLRDPSRLRSLISRGELPFRPP